MVERRRERAAEVVERRREQAAEESGAAVVNGRPILSAGALRPHKKGVFPDCVGGRLEQAAFGQGDRFLIPDHDMIQHPDINQPQHFL